MINSSKVLLTGYEFACCAIIYFLRKTDLKYRMDDCEIRFFFNSNTNSAKGNDLYKLLYLVQYM